MGYMVSIAATQRCHPSPKAATEWVWWWGCVCVNKTLFIRTGSEGHGLPAAGLNHCVVLMFACLPICISALVWNQIIIITRGSQGILESLSHFNSFSPNDSPGRGSPNGQVTLGRAWRSVPGSAHTCGSRSRSPSAICVKFLSEWPGGPVSPAWPVCVWPHARYIYLLL